MKNLNKCILCGKKIKYKDLYQVIEKRKMIWDNSRINISYATKDSVLRYHDYCFFTGLKALIEAN